LASSSTYRKALLQRLGLPFVTFTPVVDESRRAGETPADMVIRLSREKAQAVATRFPAAVIIGADQVATLGPQVLGKPGNFQRAVEQLALMRGRAVVFLTGICVLDAGRGSEQVDCVSYTAHMRNYTDEEMQTYLLREQPYDCAGSFKSEGLGIALFEKMSGDDPTALIGLPLIRLTQMLASAGMNVFAPYSHSA
jgi:MAF protein